MNNYASSVAKTPTVKVSPQEIKNEQGKQIGILAGSFNPVHQAHLLVAEQVLVRLHLDEVWFIPTDLFCSQDEQRVPMAERIAMLNLAIQDNTHFRLKIVDPVSEQVSSMVDILTILKEKDQTNTYYLIMGSDQVASLDEWQQPEKLRQLATLVGVQRPGFSPKFEYPIIWVDVPQLEISSSAIRQAAALGMSIRYLVPEAVADYISKKRLYHV